VNYHLHIKRAEIERSRTDAAGADGDPAAVTAWEHREYFDLA
jgi:hypothetical protein